MSTYYFLSLQVLKDIHLFFLLVGPMRICHAMNLYKIKKIGVELFSEALNNNISIRPFWFRNTALTDPHFGTECVGFSWNAFKSCRSKGMSAIGISTVKKADSFFICLMND